MTIIVANGTKNSRRFSKTTKQNEPITARLIILSDVMLRFSFPRRQHVIKWIVTDALSQSLHPVVLFLLATRRHSVHRVLTFDHFPFRVRFACLYEIGAATRVQLETVLLLAIGRLTYWDIFQRNNASWFFVRRKFKIVQTIIVQDEPSSFPAFVASALFPKPAFFVGIEERVHQVVAVVFWDFEGFCFYALIKTLENNIGQEYFLLTVKLHSIFSQTVKISVKNTMQPSNYSSILRFEKIQWATLVLGANTVWNFTVREKYCFTKYDFLFVGHSVG